MVTLDGILVASLIAAIISGAAVVVGLIVTGKFKKGE